MNEKWYGVGGIIFFIIMIFVSSYIGGLRTRANATTEQRIASEYCGNISTQFDTDKKWEDCYNDALNNVTNKFEILESCKKQNNKESKEWSQEEWKKCYETQDLIQQIVNN